jgi:hypothetical protein
MRRRARSVALFASLLVAVTACTGATGGTGGQPILANAPAERPTLPAPTPAPSRAADPLPVVLPRDDGPHDRLTEWWYYTGHLQADDGS